MSSPIQDLLQQLEELDGVERALAELTTLERAALASQWRGVWARDEQLCPVGGWRSFGLLGGRGSGKTLSGAKLTIDCVIAGLAPRIGLCAQSAEETLGIMVEGESGLINQSPVWFKPELVNDKLYFPDGSFCELFEATAPAAIRGHQFSLVWASEIAAFQARKLDETWSNLMLANRLNLGLTIWDTTPRRRNPLIRDLIARSAADPDVHIIRTSKTYDNTLNLAPGSVLEWSKSMSGTKAREELDGIYLDGEEEGTVKAHHIDAARREMPTNLARRIISVDPAISCRASSDETGLIDLGLGQDGQIYVLNDWTFRYRWEDWCELVVSKYLENKCDLIALERNRGGDSLVAGIRAASKDRGQNVVVVENDAITRHVPSTIYCTEVHARTSKENRLEPIAGLYAQGKISHVRSADLTELENQLTTWLPEGNAPSPNALDALVWGAWILSGIGSARPRGNSFAGLAEANRILAHPSTARRSIALEALRVAGRGRTI